MARGSKLSTSRAESVYDPSTDPATKFPIIPQVSTNGGFASDVMHDRFQVIEASMLMKGMRRWAGASPTDVYYVLDFNSWDGIRCDGVSDTPQVYTSPYIAMMFLEELKKQPPRTLPMEGGGGNAPSFRQWWWEKVGADHATSPEQIEAAFKHGLMGESLQVIIGGRRPKEKSPLQIAYDELCVGTSTEEVVKCIKVQYPSASMNSTFIEWYRGALLDYGFALPAAARERMQVPEIHTDKGGASAPETEVAAKPSRKSRPNVAPPAKPAKAKAEPAKPAKAKAEPAKPAKAKAEPAKPAKAKAEPAKPAKAKAEPAKPVKAKAEPAKPVKAKAEPAKPVKAKAEPAKPVKAKAEPAKPPKAKAEPAKPAKAKAEAFSGRTNSASSFIKELILGGELTDQKIFAQAKKKFGLEDDKFYYIQWNRNDLKRRGFNPPEPKGIVYKRGKPPKKK